MKKLILFYILIIIVLRSLGQSQGIGYQAILINENAKEIPGIDVEGNYLPNQALTIRFSILDETRMLNYQEEQLTSTDKYGMINVTIGWGDVTTNSPGTFMDIDWNGSPKDLRVEISLGELADNYEEFSLEQLKFVPYAYHRNITATGTMRIEDVTDLNSDLNVNNGSATNLSGNLTVDMMTNLNGALSVNNLSPSILTGELQVDGIADFNNDLNVNNGSQTTLSGNLEVEQTTNLNGELNVNNTSATNLSGTLTVEEETNINSNLNVNEGSSTNLSGSLDVQGETTLEHVNVTTLNTASNQESFVATFENTNDGVGDGIKIKLGKARAETVLPANSDSGITQDQIDKMKDLIGCGLDINAKLPILKDLVIEGIEADIKMQANLAIGIGNFLIDFLNAKLEIPKIQVFPGFDWSYSFPLGIGKVGFGIDPQSIGPIGLPDIPDINLSVLGFDGFDLESLDFWGIPDICLSDLIPNPLNFENEFIHFSDANNSKMGSIKAQSVVDWSQNYLNPGFMLSLRGAYTSSVDKNHAKYHFKGKINEALASYKKIGVEYSSGNGDYAEWLERIDSTEIIGAGDIVGVKGGKISKDLTNAEQIMAVSSNPIVLGNMPIAGKDYLGNNVAFMGQIPVKIMGPVNTGDYIVGKGDISGYGVAVSPENMSLEDYKNIVGRSWIEDNTTGPKMVNTVVGVHNGDYLKVLKEYDERLKSSETRLKNLEDKFELLMQSNSASKN